MIIAAIALPDLVVASDLLDSDVVDRDLSPVLVVAETEAEAIAKAKEVGYREWFDAIFVSDDPEVTMTWEEKDGQHIGWAEGYDEPVIIIGLVTPRG